MRLWHSRLLSTMGCEDGKTYLKKEKIKKTSPQPGQWLSILKNEILWPGGSAAHWGVEVWISFVRPTIEPPGHFNPCHMTGIFLALPHEAKPYIVLELPFLPFLTETTSVYLALFHTHWSHFVIQLTQQTAYVLNDKFFSWVLTVKISNWNVVLHPV